MLRQRVCMYIRMSVTIDVRQDARIANRVTSRMSG